MNQSHRLGEPLPHRVAVVRALRGLGDMLCVVPALRALRAGLPEAQITLIGLPQAREFVVRFQHYVDDLLEFPGFPGIPERPPAVHDLPAFLTRAQDEAFDLAIQMHGSGSVSNPFTVLLGAQRVAGFYLPGQYCPDVQRFLSYREHEPEVRRYLRLMEFVGLPLQGEELEFPIYAEERAALAEALGRHSLATGSYACIHPGAHDPARRWPPEHFAAVADALAGQGLQIVLTGAREEASITEMVARTMQAPALNLAGRTSLGALAALLEGARLLVCNDTGISHLAAALRTPSVIVFLTSDPARWAPLDRERHRLVGWPLDSGQMSKEPVAAEYLLRNIWRGTGRSSVATPRRVLAEAAQLLRLQQGSWHAA